MKTSSTRHVTVCFETCIAVSQSIRWEVTLARSALRAPRTGPHQFKTQPTLLRPLAGGKQMHQRDSVLESGHVSFDRSGRA